MQIGARSSGKVLSLGVSSRTNLSGFIALTFIKSIPWVPLERPRVGVDVFPRKASTRTKMTSWLLAPVGVAVGRGAHAGICDRSPLSASNTCAACTMCGDAAAAQATARGI